MVLAHRIPNGPHTAWRQNRGRNVSQRGVSE